MAWSICCVCCAGWLGGCGTLGWDWTEPRTHNRALKPGYNAFAAQAIRIHPLTHFAMVDGQAEIVCHIEMLDRWGDSVKALGTLQLQLYKPEERAKATSAVQILKWDVDLTDETFNAGAYDPATRTYRLSLGGLPVWIAQAVAKQQAEGGGGGGDGAAGNKAAVNGLPIRLELRAAFQTLGPNGQERVLRDGMGLEL